MKVKWLSIPSTKIRDGWCLVGISFMREPFFRKKMLTIILFNRALSVESEW